MTDAPTGFAADTMLILALDTTTRAGSAAVIRDGDVLAEREGDATRTHGERLPGELELVLRAAGVNARDLDLLAVATGPGAFTGLRIGLAAIQGLALALSKPVVGVSALDALAVAVQAGGGTRGLLATWMDAARGEVFASLFAGTREVAPASVASPADTLRQWQGLLAPPVIFAGDGAVKYRDIVIAAGHEVYATVPLLAVTIARLGAHRAAEGHAGPPHALQPLYVRRPDAELARSPARP